MDYNPPCHAIFEVVRTCVLTTKELSQHVASHLHLHVHTHQLGSFEIISIFLAWPTMQKKAWEKHCCQSYRV